jgi:phosphatidylcholine synthase
VKPFKDTWFTFYTASTLFFVALAAQWILEGSYRWALGALAVTIIIDATDGALARKFRVKETAAAIDGGLLDNIIDFTSYVVLPMLLLLQTGLLAPPGVLVTAFAMFSSAFGFSRTTANSPTRGSSSVFRRTGASWSFTSTCWERRRSLTPC